MQETYLNIFDPLGEEQCAHAFRHSIYIRVDCADDTNACIARKRRLEHSCELRVSVWDVVARMGVHR
jgi:hypothetical protein